MSKANSNPKHIKGDYTMRSNKIKRQRGCTGVYRKSKGKNHPAFPARKAKVSTPLVVEIPLKGRLRAALNVLEKAELRGCTTVETKELYDQQYRLMFCWSALLKRLRAHKHKIAYRWEEHDNPFATKRDKRAKHKRYWLSEYAPDDAIEYPELDPGDVADAIVAYHQKLAKQSKRKPRKQRGGADA